MNQIANIMPVGPATMSSREIADLCEKKHQHVMRDTRAMLSALGLQEGGYVQKWTDPSNGQSYPEFALPRDLTMTLVTGYSIPLRKKVIDRLDELEGRLPVLDYSDPQVMLGVFNHLQGQVAMKDEIIAELAPQAEALGRIAISEGSFCVTDAAKTLQVQPKALFQFLRSHRWIYTRAGGGAEVAYQDKLASGLLEHKTTTVHRSDGSEKTATQVRVTPKGLARLAQEFPPVARAA